MKNRVTYRIPPLYKSVLQIAILLTLLSVFGCAGSKKETEVSTESSQRGPRYEYTHIYLRQLFFLEPKTLIFAVKNSGVKFLRDIWTDDVKGDPALAKEIGCRVVRDNASETIIAIAPPKPVRPTDAYLIALVLKDGKPRYFTFEKILDVNGTGIEAALCEWTETKHQNHTLATPKPTLESFLTMIDHVMAQK